MNIHHLELYYYVARYGGISKGLRKIPYGIQQPAVSYQILRLEEHLGTTLFQRRPFELTQEGKELYEFIRPFFENLPAMDERLRGGQTRLLRVAASTVVLRHHLPSLLREIQRRYPQTRLVLREGLQPEMEDWLLAGEIDLAVTVLVERPRASIQSRVLIELPLMLLFGPGCTVKTLEDLWTADRIELPLVTLPPAEPVCRIFQSALAKKGIAWSPALEVSSLDLVSTYVSQGFGVGLTVDVPDVNLPRGVRGRRCKGFPPIVVGALWRGSLSKVALSLLDLLKRRADEVVAVRETADRATDASLRG